MHRLPFPALLALRYLKSTRRDAYVTFLSTLAAGGIGLGVAALLLVLAGLSGLQHFLREDVLSRTPHLEVELPPESDPEAAVLAFEDVDGVLSARRLLRGRGWLKSGTRVVSVEAVGFEGELPPFFPDAEGPDAEGEAIEGGVWIGDILSLGWGLEPGARIDVVSPRPTLTPFGPQPRIVQLRVAGTFRTGRTEEGERRIALPLDAARRLFGDGDLRIELRARDLSSALGLASAVRAAAPPGSEVRTWKDLNRGLFFALELEKALMFVSVFLIVPVAAMALVTVLALLISSKRSEIGMLQAMGARGAELRQAFLYLGGLLGSLGLVLGAALGLGGAVVLDRYELLAPPGDVYFVDHIPFRIEAPDVAAVVGATLLLTVLSTVWAARRAGSIRAVEVLHR